MLSGDASSLFAQAGKTINRGGNFISSHNFKVSAVSNGVSVLSSIFSVVFYVAIRYIRYDIVLVITNDDDEEEGGEEREDEERSRFGREREKKKSPLFVTSFFAPTSLLEREGGREREGSDSWARRLGSTTLNARVALAPWPLRRRRRRRRQR